MNEAKGKMDALKLPFLIGLMDAAHLEGDAKKEAGFRSSVLEEVSRLKKIDSPLDASVVCHQAADALVRCGQYQVADQLLLDAMVLVDSSTSAKNPALAGYLVRRGEIALAQGKVDLSTRLCHEAIQLINERTLSSEHPAVLDSAALAGMDAVKMNMDDEAVSFFFDVMRIVEKNELQRIDPKIADALRQYQELLLKHESKMGAEEVQALLAKTKVRQSGYN